MCTRKRNQLINNVLLLSITSTVRAARILSRTAPRSLLGRIYWLLFRSFKFANMNLKLLLLRFAHQLVASDNFRIPILTKKNNFAILKSHLQLKMNNDKTHLSTKD